MPSTTIDDGTGSGRIFDSRGGDWLDPKNIVNSVTDFSNSVRPVSSNSAAFRNGLALGKNPTPEDILNISNNLSNTLESGRLFPLPSPPPTLRVGNQPIPDLGINPDSITILGSSLYFQNTLPPGTSDGFPPLPGGTPSDPFYGNSPEALTILLNTQLAQNALLGGSLGQPWPVYPPTWPPTHGPVPFPGGGPAASPADLTAWVNNLQAQFNTAFPNLVPLNLPGGVPNFLLRFAQGSPEAQATARQQLANPTTVNQAILDRTGITDTGGLYNQGVVSDPFRQPGFLTDTNPFPKFQSGLLVPHGNGNGKVLGTPVQDVLQGKADQSNIIQGRGGVDFVTGGNRADLMDVAQGDTVMAQGGDDVMFFNFAAKPGNPFTFPTTIDGGAGEDTVVIALSADPTQSANLPKFQSAGNGVTQVTLNGRNLWTRGVERFILTDAQGNIGSVLDVSGGPPMAKI